MRTNGKTRQRRLDARIEKIIGRLIDEHCGAPRIVQELERLKGYVEAAAPRLRQATTNEELLEIAEGLAPPGLHSLDVLALLEAKIPDERTIRRRIAESKLLDTSGPWTLARASGGVAALVLPVLGAVLDHTQGRVAGLTKEQAKWVVKVRRAAPGLDPWYVWRVAAAYQVADQKGTDADRESLDALLAFAPWRSLEAAERFREWASRAHPDWFTLERFVIAPAGMPFGAKDTRPLGNAAGLLVAEDIELDFRMRALGLTDLTGARPRISIRERPANEEEESNEPPRKP